MLYRASLTALLALALSVGLTACSSKPPEEPESPESQPSVSVVAPVKPEPEPVLPYVNPLTGEGCAQDIAQKRPVAVMLNNLKKALPQLGVSQADIIYEAPAEGGITRMLGVYQSLDGVGTIGSIRSARPYYLELALGHDAIFLHAGGSVDAYDKIRQWGVPALDAVNGPYLGSSPGSNLMWRDPERRKSYSLEHTVVTTGETIMELLPTYSLRLEHEEGYTYDMDFVADGTPANGAPAGIITVPVSHYKTGVFTYDEDSGLYLVEEYGQPYLDGNTGEQVGVTNVVVLKTACRYTGDSLGHITVDLDGEGTGYFACGGQAIEIAWSKDAPYGQLRYYDLGGSPLSFGVGRTYVVIVPLDCDISFS